MLPDVVAFARRCPVVLLAAGLAVVGCACAAQSFSPAKDSGRGGPPAVRSVTLQERAQQYWARRQAKDLLGAYPFYCAAYRSRVSQAQYLQLSRLNRFDFVSVDVVGAEPIGDRFDVTIAYRFIAPTVSDQPLNGRTSERWARDSDGLWCKEDEPALLPFPSAR